MRTVTKTVSLPVDGNNVEFRITKLDAFSGAKLLKLLSHADTDNLQELVLGLSEYELESLMKTCLRSVAVLLPAGPMKVMDEGGNWGYPELEYDSWNCLKLTMEVIQWTLEGFFPESGRGS